MKRGTVYLFIFNFILIGLAFFFLFYIFISSQTVYSDYEEKELETAYIQLDSEDEENEYITKIRSELKRAVRLTIVAYREANYSLALYKENKSNTEGLDWSFSVELSISKLKEAEEILENIHNSMDNEEIREIKVDALILEGISHKIYSSLESMHRERNNIPLTGWKYIKELEDDLDYLDYINERYKKELF